MAKKKIKSQILIVFNLFCLVAFSLLSLGLGFVFRFVYKDLALTQFVVYPIEYYSHTFEKYLDSRAVSLMNVAQSQWGNSSELFKTLYQISKEYRLSTLVQQKKTGDIYLNEKKISDSNYTQYIRNQILTGIGDPYTVYFRIAKNTNNYSTRLWLVAQSKDTYFGFGIDYTEIIKMITSFENRELSTFFIASDISILLIDNQGNILLHRNPAVIGQKNITNFIPVSQSTILLSRNRFSDFPSQLDNKLYYYLRPIQTIHKVSPEVSLIWMISHDLIFHEIQKQFFAVMLFLIGFFILILVSGNLWLYRKVRRPLMKLTEITQDIARNNFTTDKPSKYFGEVDEMAQAVFALKKTMQGYHEHLEELIRSRTEELEVTMASLQKKEELIRKEIEFASSIQNGLFPLPTRWNELEITPYVRQKEDVGGDILDLIEKEKRLFCYLADISGHGVSASLVSMLAKIVFLYALQNHSLLDDVIREVNTRVNSLINHQMIKYINYFTVFAVFLKADYGFDFVSAGHIPAILYRRETNTCQLLSTSSSMIGVFDSHIVKFQIGSEQLKPGDILFLLSDGLVNAKNKSGRKYGFEHLMSMLVEHSALSGDKLLRTILEDLKRFEKDTPQEDDISFLLIQRQTNR